VRKKGGKVTKAFIAENDELLLLNRISLVFINMFSIINESITEAKF
jgi:hypothetical protein